MGDCQNYGPFWGPHYNTGPNTGPNLGDPKRDHNFDNPPYNFGVQAGFIRLSAFSNTAGVPRGFRGKVWVLGGEVCGQFFQLKGSKFKIYLP